MSSRGRHYLAAWEGVVLHPYNDAGSNATIGIGHLVHYGPVTPADVQRYRAYHGPHGHRREHAFDLEDAYTLLSDDLESFERDLADYIHAPLTQNQVDATLDLVYNCGPAPLAGRFGELLNAREYAAAASELLNWDHVDGQVNEQLAARRSSERSLFLTR